jgi:hypothetical protein
MPMRWAKSYSIVDHQLLHGGYLHRLSQAAMSLYLFLVVVGDRQGRSFYSEVSIMEILRLPEEAFTAARLQLLQEGLIDYRRPHWWVKTLTQQPRASRPQTAASARSVACDERLPSPPAVEAKVASRETARRHLDEIFRMLKQKGGPQS